MKFHPMIEATNSPVAAQGSSEWRPARPILSNNMVFREASHEGVFGVQHIGLTPPTLVQGTSQDQMRTDVQGTLLTPSSLSPCWAKASA